MIIVKMKGWGCIRVCQKDKENNIRFFLYILLKFNFAVEKGLAFTRFRILVLLALGDFSIVNKYIHVFFFNDVI